jgi:hypothetical protein
MTKKELQKLILDVADMNNLYSLTIAEMVKKVRAIALSKSRVRSEIVTLIDEGELQVNHGLKIVKANKKR